jgi:hypothetical protein
MRDTLAGRAMAAARAREISLGAPNSGSSRSDRSPSLGVTPSRALEGPVINPYTLFYSIRPSSLSITARFSVSTRPV